MSIDVDILIIGAGLTGLSSAITARAAGASVLVLDRAERIGGRMKTDIVEGFTLDHGFQVILDSYPELIRLNILSELEAGSFWAGAKVFYQGREHTLLDPRRHPRSLLALLPHLPKFVTLLDPPRLLSLYLRSPAQEPGPLRRISTQTFLEERGLSRTFRTGFFAPFFSGVLLDPNLEADAALFEFLLSMFGRGSALLARKGAQTLPLALAKRLSTDSVQLGRAVTNVAQSRVQLNTGESITARAIICACDASAAHRLGAPIAAPMWRPTTTLYFEAQEAPYRDPILFLDADRTGPINHLAVVTNVQPCWSVTGSALISCSVVGSAALKKEHELVEAARLQLQGFFGERSRTWRHLRTAIVAEALPTHPALGPGWIGHNGIIYAGDYLSYGSQNGSLAAGRRAAEHALARL